MNHTLSVVVEDKPGVLARVSSLLARRGFNIHSLAVGPSHEDGMSRMTVVVEAEDIEQVKKQLHKLINVVKISEFDPETSVGWGHSQLWCDYHLKMYFARYAANRQHLKEYLQNWHQRTGRPQDQLVAFDVWWISDKSPGPGEAHGKPQKPVLLSSYGKVSDSGAKPWLELGGATSALP